jgi:hypothetical protein
VKSNYEVERALPEWMRCILQLFNPDWQHEVRVRCGQVQSDDAAEREFLPRTAAIGVPREDVFREPCHS